MLVLLVCLLITTLSNFVGTEPELLLKVNAANKLAETGQCGDNVYWNFNSTTGELVISGTGSMWDYSPINDSPFTADKNIKRVIINSDITTIGDFIFLFCHSIETVTIPNTITSIGEASFSNCSKISNIKIPDSVIVIGESAFEKCSSITNINIPSNVETIESNAFFDCTKLTSFDVAQTNHYYSNDDHGVLFNKAKTTLIQYPEGNPITHYELPNSTETIETYAFHNCDYLESLVFNQTLISIKYNAINGCDNITELIIPDNVEDMSDSIFNCKNLMSITLGANVKSIHDDPFVVPFQSCDRLEKFIVHKDNKKYSSENGVLYNADKSMLVRYPLGNKNTYFTIPDSITSMQRYTFFGCLHLKKIALNDGLSTIDSQAFIGCFSLQEIVIPISLKTIEVSNFLDCYELKYVYYEGTKLEWDKIIIKNGNDDLLNANIIFSGISASPIDIKILSPIMYTVTSSEHTNSATFTKLNEVMRTEKISAWDISLYLDGVETQPDGYIAVSISLPQGYTPSKCKIFYIDTETKEFVDMNATYENGYFTFMTNHFSVYAIAEIHEHSYTEDTEVCIDCGFDRTEGCSCKCHKNGILGFFWKLINFFNKLFKLNEICSCGITHY